ncbi:hypothetical protein IQ260_06165 [Leptolyngbya cf. ectocarpi LEGE 11479]|uniref:Co-chaperone DjlA N-terminal domain-containing protein n=1 Tax=Leptolyngbya cf. ectocarpi LEGE 11479 TaxID=1828722 RepID=A0A928X464_LEPEC|nr:hypothetical protein [Leptolyngbya ectocarpi]MBE9066233.1 hypothetical protein [Leptolyngbya cf. ectocarpi LEGE 11479]
MQALFQKIFNQQPSGVTQTQREAMVDLCLLGMYSDSKLSVDEQDFLDEEFDKLSWESGISFGSYLQRVIPKVRSATNDVQEREEFLQDIAQRLGDDGFKQTAIDALQNLLAADGMVQLESTFMAAVSKAMSL